MRTLPFKTLLTAFLGAARAGRANLQPQEEEQFCADLNAAALCLWEVETHSQALPDMLAGQTVTLSAGGVIPAATIDTASFWSVWKSDPRLSTDPNARARLNLQATGLANGDVKVLDAHAGDEVYVLYKTRPPQWTIEAPSSARTYDIGDLVNCDGRVYRSLVNEASAGDITDPALWEEQTLPVSLQRIVVTKANYERIRLGANMPENAGRERFEYERALDAAFLGAQNEPGAKIWLYNQNQ